jgi:hypothetical protein
MRPSKAERDASFAILMDQAGPAPFCVKAVGPSFDAGSLCLTDHLTVLIE